MAGEILWPLLTGEIGATGQEWGARASPVLPAVCTAGTQLVQQGLFHTWRHSKLPAKGTFV